MSNSANGQIPKISQGAGDKTTPINMAIDGFDSMIAGAFVGANPVNLAGLTTYTLTDAQALSPFLEFTGALTGDCAVSIDVTALKGKVRWWMFYQHTTGGHNVVIKLSNAGTRFGSGVTPTVSKRGCYYHTNFGGGANGDIFQFTADF